jgi:hypothetical protein
MKLYTVLIARVLALVWAVFWMFFFITESLVWRTPPLVMAAWVAVGLLFLVVALVPWFWETSGGVLLISVGLLTGVAYTVWAPSGLAPAVRLVTAFVFGAPPLIAGALFLMHHHATTARA